MQANFRRPFSRYVKKAPRPLQLAFEDVVEAICSDPEMGEMKTGDLAGIWVYKFRFNRQEYLVAYRPPNRTQPVQPNQVDFPGIDFYLVGSHENFYRTLKRYLREE